MALGDSFTDGANVAEDEAYPEVLEDLLNSRAATRVEVVNAGVGGWDTSQYAAYYQHYGWKFSPDLILVGLFVGNDVIFNFRQDETLTAIMGHRAHVKDASNPLIHLKIFLYQNSLIARGLLSGQYIGFNTTVNVKREICSDFSDKLLAAQRYYLPNHLKTKDQERRNQLAVEQIRKIKKLAERDSIPVVVVLIPDEAQINTDLRQALLTDEDRKRFDFDMPQAALKGMFADAAIPVINLLPYFRNDSRCLYMNDGHWTAEGHELAASIIYESIIAEYMKGP